MNDGRIRRLTLAVPLFQKPMGTPHELQNYRDGVCVCGFNLWFNLINFLVSKAQSPLQQTHLSDAACSFTDFRAFWSLFYVVLHIGFWNDSADSKVAYLVVVHIHMDIFLPYRTSPYRCRTIIVPIACENGMSRKILQVQFVWVGYYQFDTTSPKFIR